MMSAVLLLKENFSVDVFSNYKSVTDQSNWVKRIVTSQMHFYINFYRLFFLGKTFIIFQ